MKVLASRRSLKKVIAFAVVALTIPAAAVLLVSNKSVPVSAVSVANWSAGRIIDDSVFTKTSTMSVSQIQTFLNSKVTSCDTNGTQIATDFGSTLTHAQYAASRGWSAPPYTCLKDYSENGLSSAQIIYNAAQNYDINPEVLIVLLQKEQGLVTDTWPLATEYTSATGYGCPDGAPCSSQYYGLTNQLNNAANMYHDILTANPNWYSPYSLGNNTIHYNPGPYNNTTGSYYGQYGTRADITYCGSSTVNIQNLSTVALYDYTPYQPDQAALNAGYGNGDLCSSYGNRNFYLYFNDWFGNTIGSDYSATINSVTLYSDASYSNPISESDGTYILTPGQSAYVNVSVMNNGRATWDSLTRLGTANPNDRLSPFYSSSWLGLQRPAQLTTMGTVPYATSGFRYQITAPQTDGIYSESYGLVEDGVTWFGDAFSLPIQVASPVAAPANYTANVLAQNTSLLAGQSLISPDKFSALTLTTSGNLELRRNYQIVWTAGVSAGSNATLAMQADGNLVLYTQSGVAVWNSHTDGLGSSTLKLQDDGNLVVYTTANVATWNSGTGIAGTHLSYPTLSVANSGIMYANQIVQSADRRYTFYLQGDGNLVLYSPTQAIWSSNTVGSGGAMLIMQGDGNLVLYTISGKAVWSSNTAGSGASSLYVQSDGNMVLYNSQGAIWATWTTGKP